LDGLHDIDRPVTDDNDDSLDRQLGQGVEHVKHHRPSAQTMEGLRRRRTHPRALASSEHDRGQRAAGHGPILAEGPDPCCATTGDVGEALQCVGLGWPPARPTRNFRHQK